MMENKPEGALELKNIFSDLEPYLSEKALLFIKNNQPRDPTKCSDERMTYMGKIFKAALSAEVFKVFATKMNAVIELLTPEEYLAYPIALELKEAEDGTPRWMLLWYCRYAEFKSSQEAMTWHNSFFDAANGETPL